MGFFIALIIAALSGMGVGGGGLFALWLKLFTDLGQIRIQAINLIFFFFASGAALSVHLRRRRIYPLAVLVMVIFGIFGSFLGSALALYLEGALLGKLFGAMMICAGIPSRYTSHTFTPHSKSVICVEASSVHIKTEIIK